MYGRILALIFALALAEPAWGHALKADYRILPDQQVRVEAWFDISDDPARGAKVQVFDEDGKVLVEDRLDSKGLFVFTVDKPRKLRVLVNAGAGHRKELLIPATAFGGRMPVTVVRAGPPEKVPAGDSRTTPTGDPDGQVKALPSASAPAPEVKPLPSRPPDLETKPTPAVQAEQRTPTGERSQVGVKEVLIGVGFLLALAAFVLSLRNARQLRELKKGASAPPAV